MRFSWGYSGGGEWWQSSMVVVIWYVARDIHNNSIHVIDAGSLLVFLFCSVIFTSTCSFFYFIYCLVNVLYFKELITDVRSCR